MMPEMVRSMFELVRIDSLFSERRRLLAWSCWVFLELDCVEGMSKHNGERTKWDRRKESGLERSKAEVNNRLTILLTEPWVLRESCEREGSGQNWARRKLIALSSPISKSSWLATMKNTKHERQG